MPLLLVAPSCHCAWQVKSLPLIHIPVLPVGVVQWWQTSSVKGRGRRSTLTTSLRHSPTSWWHGSGIGLYWHVNWDLLLPLLPIHHHLLPPNHVHSYGCHHCQTMHCLMTMLTSDHSHSIWWSIQWVPAGRRGGDIPIILIAKQEEGWHWWQQQCHSHHEIWHNWPSSGIIVNCHGYGHCDSGSGEGGGDMALAHHAQWLSIGQQWSLPEMHFIIHHCHMF